MARLVFALLPALLLAAACTGPETAPEDDLFLVYPDLQGPIHRLEALETVGGNATGFGAGPDEFWLTYVELRDAEHDGLAERLLDREEPICRSMGLVLLAHDRGEDAAPILRRFLDDREPIRLCPTGCVTRDSTVAAVARGLLLDRLYLEPVDEPEPLLPERDLVRMDFDLLARDDSATVHGLIRKDNWGFLEPLLPLDDLDEIAKMAPGLSKQDLVKAIGRLLPNFPKARDLLERIRTDEKQPAAVRKAAKSGLTRTYEADFWEKDPTALLDRTRNALYAVGDPYEEDPPDPRPIILELSERLPEWSQGWNTWSDTAWLLDYEFHRYPEAVARVLTEEELELVRERIRRATLEND